MKQFDEKIELLIDQQALAEEVNDGAVSADQQKVDFELQLQQKIDASLGRLFTSEPVKEATHRRKIETLVSRSKVPDRRSSAVRILVLAASVMLLASLVFWQFDQRKTSEIVYQRKPLVDLYQDSLDRGFRPYYVCDDPVRFAAQFEKQLGVPLRLAEMPEHKRMAGISFLGGVSRKTTAMLGRVNNEPVLVFVDELSKDDDQMQEQVGENGQFHVSRATKDGLVFYEISKFKDGQFIEYFERENP
jgi:hypothetical protein